MINSTSQESEDLLLGVKNKKEYKKTHELRCNEEHAIDGTLFKQVKLKRQN